MADARSREGLRYGNPDVVRFVDALHCKHDAALAAAFNAPASEGMPSIQVGVAEGKLLQLLASLLQARRAVEIGTLAGFSAIHLARGMNDGTLFSIESEPRHAAVARQRIAFAKLADRITVVEGDAAAVLPDLVRHGPFDLVFLDADKGRYDVYARWAVANLRPGGVLLADNAYYFGHLLREEDPDAEAMRRFHRESADALDSVCIPTPDGLLLGIKRKS
jgi:caffeoyl-CoA O-methyltransferase